MFDGLLQFFSTFQPKDWVTFSIALAAAGIAGTQAVRGHLNHHQLLLKEQADFSAQWVYPSMMTENWSVLILTNIGNARAYDVQMSLNIDPGHLLGLAENAAGPIETGVSLRGHLTRSAQLLGTPGTPGSDQDIQVVIEWTDQFGIRRRQRIKHTNITGGGFAPSLPEAYNQVGEVEKLKFYMGIPMGATSHYDPRFSIRGRGWKPRQRRRPKSS